MNKIIEKNQYEIIKTMERILQVVGIMNTGGIETWLMNVYRNIDRSKIQFDFVVHTNKKGYYDEEILKLGGNIFPVPQFKIINSYKYKKAWKELLKKYDNKIIHTHIRSTAPLFLKIAKKYGYKTIAHAHSTSNGISISSFIKDYFQWNIVKYSDIRLACSTEAGKWLFRNNSYAIIKNGINVSLYIFDEKTRNNYRKTFNYKDDDIVIGHVGRFTYPKNHEFLIAIFMELYKRNTQFKLILVGDGGELKELIKTKIKTLGLEKNVACIGARSDIPQLLQMMDLFMFPSHFEGLGIALIEAQTAGLSCFISDTIPREAIITKMVHSISLNESAGYWANIIMNNLDHKREDTSLDIQNSGFDIRLVVKQLEDLYLTTHVS